MGHSTNASIQPQRPQKAAQENPSTSPPTVTLTPSTAHMVDSIFQLLKRPPTGEKEEMDDSYLGYDRWLPRSVFNAAALAYLGDCIYELYARRLFLFPPPSIEEYNDCVTVVVRCEAQVGYPYLPNMKRLEEIMVKIGFSTDSPVQLILAEVTYTKLSLFPSILQF